MEIVTNNFEFLENGLGITLVVFLPLISALVVALLPKKQELLIKLTALGSSLITFILSVIVAIQFDYWNEWYFRSFRFNTLLCIL